eukprot:753432-Hanusia_phi.AAC.4
MEGQDEQFPQPPLQQEGCSTGVILPLEMGGWRRKIAEELGVEGTRMTIGPVVVKKLSVFKYRIFQSFDPDSHNSYPSLRAVDGSSEGLGGRLRGVGGPLPARLAHGGVPIGWVNLTSRLRDLLYGRE